MKTLSEMQFPVKDAEKIRPWLLSTMLEDESDGDSELQHALGLDAYFFKKAKLEGKKLMFLESARDQVDSMAKLPNSQQEFLLKDALQKEPVEGEITLNETLELWKDGDADTLEFHYRNHHKNQMEIYQHIIINRNL